MNRQKLLHIFLLYITAFLLPYILQYSIPAFEDLELKTLDWRIHWRGAESIEDSPIVLVTIDDNSAEALPDRWPWPRSYYAHAIENLTRAGAKVIGIDVILDVPDKLGSDKDSLLAATVRKAGNVVLARKLEQHARLKSYKYLVDPIPSLKEAAGNQLGLVSIQSDGDGIYRRYPIMQVYQDQFLSSFAIELIRKYKNYGPDVTINPVGQGFEFGDLQIPIYQSGSILINYAGPGGTFPQYSFSSLVDDENYDLGEDYDLDYFTENLLPDEVFKDKIVLIGSTIAELHDNFPTPFLSYNGAVQETAGVEILANAVQTILSGSYYATLPPGVNLLVVLMLILLVQFLSFKTPTTWSIVLTITLILIYGVSQYYLFTEYRLIMEMITPVLAMALAFVSTNLYQFVLTQREKKQIMGAFEHYVPAKVIKELMDDPEKLSLGGEERVITVLFSDVANFTTISESLTPHQLVTLINEYLSEMTEIILAFDGIIDKYEGDAIMAEFGAPVHYDDHALKACCAALKIHQQLRELSRAWRRAGRPVLTCRVGINTGNMIVGNMGSKTVFDYTVIGDEVNLASRLEGANKPFGTRNMISEATYQIVKEHMVTRPLDLIIVKGKSKPVKVFELIARKEDELDRLLKALLPLYSDGISYYELQQWDKAARIFEKALQLIPDDGPSKLYLNRCQKFLINPPPVNWDGVYELKSK